MIYSFEKRKDGKLEVTWEQSDTECYIWNNQGEQHSYMTEVDVTLHEDDLKELIEGIWDIWDEDGKNKERIGEFIERMGKGEFVTALDHDVIPEMVAHPRENPYIFYDEYLEDDGE